MPRYAKVMFLNVKEAIFTRRAYRALAPVEISDTLVQTLAESIQLAPSCFNNQPWRFVFVRSVNLLKELHSTLSKNNRWVEAGSLIVVVYSQKNFDCELSGRDYYLFDTGMATAFLILRATEVGLVAHPIAGYNEERIKEVLQLRPEVTVITLVIVGKHSTTVSPLLTEHQAKTESMRPARKPIEELILIR